MYLLFSLQSPGFLYYDLFRSIEYKIFGETFRLFKTNGGLLRPSNSQSDEHMEIMWT